jgi:hypothetical protein
MINLIYITAKGMPAMRNTQAAAGRHAPMLIGSIVGTAMPRAWGNLLGAAFGKQTLRRCLQSAIFGVSKPASFAYAAVGNGSNGFGATNPPFDDNSPGKARLKLR